MMIKNGIRGAESCAELAAPHFGTYTVDAIGKLEGTILREENVDAIGAALAGFYRMFDMSGVQVAYDQAPEPIQNLVLTVRDGAEAKIAAAGVDPKNFNVMPKYI